MRHSLQLFCFFAGFGFALFVPVTSTPVVKNIFLDYGAAPSLPAQQQAELLQKAVDDVGKAGGGTVVIPGDQRGWTIDRPIFVGYPDVTITGEGMGTYLSGAATAFILGIKTQYPQAITIGHYPKISQDAGILDDSVRGSKFGLRTFDGKTKASGYFPACPLAFGGCITHHEGDIYWIDYERGVGKPVFWKNEPQYTINLSVKNNGVGVMKGVLCGVGPGGLTTQTTTGGITDPLNIWTIESDAKNGANLAFKFKTLDGQGKETTRILPLSPEPVGPGVLRISIQLDFTSGACRAWYSRSTHHALPPVLVSKVELGGGTTMKAFQYGAFRLGAVSDNPFSGSPSDGTANNGDWTYCGFSLFRSARYSLKGQNDILGAVQKRIDDDTTVPTDLERYFPDRYTPTLVSWLPLDEQLPQILARYADGRGSDERTGYGYWLPGRPLQPIAGTFTVKNMTLAGFWSSIGEGVSVGEASHVVVQDVRMPGGYYNGIGSWDCNPPNALVEVQDCQLAANGALFYGKSEDLRINDVDGGSPETDFRLVGCRGEITHVLITGFLAADYYMKIHAGPYGGPLTINYFCIDNEGLAYVPKKADFYAEPSLNPGSAGNVLTFRGGIYSGTAPAGSAVLELADPPGSVDARVTGKFSIDYLDLGSDARSPCECVIRCKSARWSGVLMNTDSVWTERPTLAYGLLKYEGVPNMGKIQTITSDSSTLPTKGAWLVGSHVLRLPNLFDPKIGQTNYTEYRCVQSGTYGTAQEPKWQAVKVSK